MVDTCTGVREPRQPSPTQGIGCYQARFGMLGIGSIPLVCNPNIGCAHLNTRKGKSRQINLYRQCLSCTCGFGCVCVCEFIPTMHGILYMWIWVYVCEFIPTMHGILYMWIWVCVCVNLYQQFMLSCTCGFGCVCVCGCIKKVYTFFLCAQLFYVCLECSPLQASIAESLLRKLLLFDPYQLRCTDYC